LCTPAARESPEPADEQGARLYAAWLPLELMACVLGTGFDKKRRRLWALSLLMLAATILPGGVRRRQQRHQSSTTGLFKPDLCNQSHFPLFSN